MRPHCRSARRDRRRAAHVRTRWQRARVATREDPRAARPAVSLVEQPEDFMPPLAPIVADGRHPVLHGNPIMAQLSAATEDRGLDQMADALPPHPLLVLAVLQDAPEGDLHR